MFKTVAHTPPIDAVAAVAPDDLNCGWAVYVQCPCIGLGLTATVLIGAGHLQQGHVQLCPQRKRPGRLERRLPDNVPLQHKGMFSLDVLSAMACVIGRHERLVRAFNA
jgi:hypothetical protein